MCFAFPAFPALIPHTFPPSAYRVLKKKTAGHLNACLPTLWRVRGRGVGVKWAEAAAGRDAKRNGARHSIYDKQWTRQPLPLDTGAGSEQEVARRGAQGYTEQGRGKWVWAWSERGLTESQ